MNTNDPLIDIHTHVIPGVDDGSKSLEMSLMMLEKMAKDGITDVILTPHVQSSATKKPRDEQIRGYKTLKEAAKDLKINLHLGAEILYNSQLQTNYDDYRLAGSNYILLEFRTYDKNVDIPAVIYNLVQKGYQVILAHAERYDILTIEDYEKIHRMGAYIQLNTGAVTKLRGRKEYSLCKKLLSLQLVHFIASDTHNIVSRAPNLKEAYDFLMKRKYDKTYLRKIFYENQKEILKFNT